MNELLSMSRPTSVRFTGRTQPHCTAHCASDWHACPVQKSASSVRRLGFSMSVASPAGNAHSSTEPRLILTLLVPHPLCTVQQDSHAMAQYEDRNADDRMMPKVERVSTRIGCLSCGARQEQSGQVRHVSTSAQRTE